MDGFKKTRWEQRFENYARSYKLIENYSNIESMNEIETAGLIQFFEVTLELAWKVMKDYLESEQYIVKSPRETIKQAFQYGLIDNGDIWLEALEDRNKTVHTYDKVLAEEMKNDILQIYLPEMRKLYEKLGEKLS